MVNTGVMLVGGNYPDDLATIILANRSGQECYAAVVRLGVGSPAELIRLYIEITDSLHLSAA